MIENRLQCIQAVYISLGNNHRTFKMHGGNGLDDELSGEKGKKGWWNNTALIVIIPVVAGFIHVPLGDTLSINPMIMSIGHSMSEGTFMGPITLLSWRS